jgi:hypothetical protein
LNAPHAGTYRNAAASEVFARKIDPRVKDCLAGRRQCHLTHAVQHTNPDRIQQMRRGIEINGRADRRPKGFTTGRCKTPDPGPPFRRAREHRIDIVAER